MSDKMRDKGDIEKIDKERFRDSLIDGIAGMAEHRTVSIIEKIFKVFEDYDLERIFCESKEEGGIKK